MAKSGRNWFAFFPCIARLFACASVPAADTPANVEGTWKISVSGEAGSAEQIILLKQDGGKIRNL